MEEEKCKNKQTDTAHNLCKECFKDGVKTPLEIDLSVNPPQLLCKVHGKIDSY